MATRKRNNSKQFVDIETQGIFNTASKPHLDWLLGGNPKAIEVQEQIGQNQFINSIQMPTKCNYPYSLKKAIDVYQKFGFKFKAGSKG